MKRHLNKQFATAFFGSLGTIVAAMVVQAMIAGDFQKIVEFRGVGEEMVFNVTGGANEIISYTINNGANQTLSLNATGTGVITISNPDQIVVVDLLNITNGSCSKTLTISSNAEVVSCDIPKGISPNGDGLNDTWNLTGYNVKNVEIFNRYGTKVYSKSNYTDEWHGQSDSSNELPDGTYYYVVEFNDSPVKTGWVYINREQ
mgnify:CR=1 FL=1